MRTLLVAFVLLSIPLAWIAYRVRAAQRQSRAVVAITRLGGDVEYDYQYDAYHNWLARSEVGEQYLEPDPPGSAVLRRSLGDDLFNGLASYFVAEVRFPRYAMSSSRGRYLVADITDDDLRVLSDLPGLREISLEFQPITDVGLRHLGNVKTLKRVNLYGTKITNEAIETLTELPELEDLNVGGTQVTVPALRKLVDKKRVRYLQFSDDQIKSAGGSEQVTHLFPTIDVGQYDANETGGVSMGSLPRD